MVLHFTVDADRLGDLEDNGISEGGGAPLEDGEVRLQSHVLIGRWEVLRMIMKDGQQQRTVL